MPASTHHDTLARLLVPAVAGLIPGSEIRRQKRVDYAIGDDGRLNPSALLLTSAAVIDGALNDTLYSTASTVTYATGATLNTEILDGTWSVLFVAMSRGTHSAGASINYRTRLQGVAGTLITRPAVAAGASPFASLQKMTLDGAQTVVSSIEFKSDTAGTSSVSDTVLLLFALRTS